MAIPPTAKVLSALPALSGYGRYDRACPTWFYGDDAWVVADEASGCSERDWCEHKKICRDCGAANWLWHTKSCRLSNLTCRLRAPYRGCGCGRSKPIFADRAS